MAVSRRLVEERTDISTGRQVVNANETIPLELLSKLNNDLSQLVSGKPLQYIIGVADFGDLRLKVNNSTLIPRPETEELVATIVQDHRNKKMRTLDIGTGSGCIALLLKKLIPEAIVTGIDVSAEAIHVANENAEELGLAVNFIKKDITVSEDLQMMGVFDVIVSNPPYITTDESEKLHSNVIDHEPHQALFVGHDDPIYFYKVILDFAKEHLSQDGSIYFEINESFGPQLIELCTKMDFIGEIKKDLAGKDRMLLAHR